VYLLGMVVARNLVPSSSMITPICHVKGAERRSRTSEAWLSKHVSQRCSGASEAEDGGLWTFSAHCRSKPRSRMER
jgi:hypothetical protein